MNLLETLKLGKAVIQMGALLQKFDGIKTLLGCLVVGAYYVLPTFHVTPPGAMLTAGLVLTGVGVTHKFEKAFGVVTTVLDWGHKILDGAQTAVDTLSK